MILNDHASVVEIQVRFVLIKYAPLESKKKSLVYPATIIRLGVTVLSLALDVLGHLRQGSVGYHHQLRWFR